MARLQTRGDKERFFAELDRLGEPDTDDEVDSDDILSSLSLSDGLANLDHRSIDPVVIEDNEDAVDNDEPQLLDFRRRPRNDVPLHRSISQLTRPVSRASGRIIDLTAESSSNTDTDQRIVRLNPHVSVGDQSLDIEEISDYGTERTRRGARSHIKINPMHRQLFRGMVFFFVPNDTKSPLRNTRVRRSKEYGARCLTKFDSSVTHIIVEPRIDYSELGKAFPNKKVPNVPYLVKNSWLSESIRDKQVKSPHQARFIPWGAPVSWTTDDNPPRTVLKRTPADEDENWSPMQSREYQYWLYAQNMNLKGTSEEKMRAMWFPAVP